MTISAAGRARTGLWLADGGLLLIAATTLPRFRNTWPEPRTHRSGALHVAMVGVDILASGVVLRLCFEAPDFPAAGFPGFLVGVARCRSRGRGRIGLPRGCGLIWRAMRLSFQRDEMAVTDGPGIPPHGPRHGARSGAGSGRNRRPGSSSGARVGRGARQEAGIDAALRDTGVPGSALEVVG